MKFQRILSIAAVITLSIFSSCGNDGAASDSKTTGSENPASTTGAQDMTTAPPTANPATPEPPQNAAGVWHYTCPKGCAGGAGSAIACAKCGTMLTHNQVYHGTPNPSTAGSPSDPTSQTPGAAPATKQPEPPQNAAGVWHYTCTAGCAGGAGSAVPCAKCGKMLEHNKAYHQ